MTSASSTDKTELEVLGGQGKYNLHGRVLEKRELHRDPTQRAEEGLLEYCTK
jgi:hypothetical protein